jgi:hypothetical protein
MTIWEYTFSWNAFKSNFWTHIQNGWERFDLYVKWTNTKGLLFDLRWKGNLDGDMVARFETPMSGEPIYDKHWEVDEFWNPIPDINILKFKNGLWIVYSRIEYIDYYLVWDKHPRTISVSE